MSDPILFLQLFWVFFLIGLFTFGGGYAMLSLIQAQVVVSHPWLTESAFTDIVAISQMTPGPVGINCATYVGYEVIHQAGASHLVGILGSLTATLAVMLPSFLIVLTIHQYSKGKFLRLDQLGAVRGSGHSLPLLQDRTYSHTHRRRPFGVAHLLGIL